LISASFLSIFRHHPSFEDGLLKLPYIPNGMCLTVWP
jgi:hypothetical protein